VITVFNTLQSFNIYAQSDCLNQKDKQSFLNAKTNEPIDSVLETLMDSNFYQDSIYQQCILGIVLDKAQKSNKSELFALYYLGLVHLMAQFGENDNADKAYQSFRFYNQKNPIQKKKFKWNCMANLQIIHLYAFSGKQDQALILADSTFELAKSMRDTSFMINSLRRMCQINQTLDNWQEAEKYIDLARVLIDRKVRMRGGNLIFWLDLHSDWIWTKFNNKKFDECERVLPDFYEKATTSKDERSLSDYFNFSAAIQKVVHKNFKKALVEIDSSIYYANKIGEPSKIIESNFEKCEILNELGRWQDMLHASDLLFKEVEKYDAQEFVHSLHYLTAIAYSNLGDYENAYRSMEQYKIANDSFMIHSKEDLVHKYNVKFETKEKEAKIQILHQQQQAQEALAQKRLWLIIALALLLALLGVSSYFYYKNSEKEKQLAQQEKALQQEKINLLEKEKQLVAADSIIKGQEDERSRLGRDLHDGLGGLLSGVKLSLSSMNLHSMDEIGYQIFKSTIQKLDESIIELRRISHNMIPETLNQFGLQVAIENYCRGFNSAKLSLIPQVFGSNSRFDKTSELIIFRIVQELINNAVKHSEATQILVQIIQQEETIQITVEDNGKGFNLTSPTIYQSSGLQNIQSRVNYLGGKMDIHSTSSGSSFLIEIPISNH